MLPFSSLGGRGERENPQAKPIYESCICEILLVSALLLVWTERQQLGKLRKMKPSTTLTHLKASRGLLILPISSAAPLSFPRVQFQRSAPPSGGEENGQVGSPSSQHHGVSSWRAGLVRAYGL